ncbi:hypothetical protein T12_11137 [Trichinella patagoniensis]|uniref:Uncharacterized protein n=1 Tax=Trichinella patagoniensis TaxID=990121 RepID=A0A0V1A8B4_9BILA|nr:hypothetical protein T12_11137 [Trichinella patagoniensis]
MISHVRIERSDSIDNQHSIGSMTNYNSLRKKQVLHLMESVLNKLQYSCIIHMHCIGNMGSIETLPNGIKRKISQNI